MICVIHLHIVLSSNYFFVSFKYHHHREAGSVDLRRSWVLPLLVRVVPRKSSRLHFFANQMIPLADRALTVARTVVASMTAKQEKVGNAALITASITVTRQIWAGLSMFVRQAPQDWSELSTGGLGRRLVKELTSTSALRPTVLMALRRLALAAAHSGIHRSALLAHFIEFCK